MRKIISLLLLLIIFMMIGCDNKQVYDYNDAEQKYKAEQILLVDDDWHDDSEEDWNKVKVWYKEAIFNKYTEGYMVIYYGNYMFVCKEQVNSGTCIHSGELCIDFDGIINRISKLEIVRRSK